MGYIGACVDSILSEARCSRFTPEIFVVDNGSTDGTANRLRELKRRHPQVMHPIFLDGNYGTTYPRNIAIKKASGNYICIMDSDIEIQPHAVSTLVQSLAADPDIGLIAPKLIYPNGKLQKSIDQFPTLFRKLQRYFFLRSMEKTETDPGKANGDVDYAISAFWVMPAHVRNRVNGLDEAYFYAPEDVDFCLELWKKGFRVVYCPSACAVHHTQEISRGFRLNRAMVQHLLGLVYYFKKHGYLFRKPNFKP